MITMILDYSTRDIPLWHLTVLCSNRSTFTRHAPVRSFGLWENGAESFTTGWIFWYSAVYHLCRTIATILDCIKWTKCSDIMDSKQSLSRSAMISRQQMFHSVNCPSDVSLSGLTIVKKLHCWYCRTRARLLRTLYWSHCSFQKRC